jgi:bisphosphoglycerate-dependent phosphoglycerate mutase
MEYENPDFYAQIHRRYNLAPAGGESLAMVEKRVISFLGQLRELIRQNPGNVAVSCHGNSMRSIRRVFEHLSIDQMFQLKSPQDCAIVYEIQQPDLGIEGPRERIIKIDWEGIVISRKVRLATDALNMLNVFYC